MNRRLANCLGVQTLNDSNFPRNSQFHQPLNQVKFGIVSSLMTNISEQKMEVNSQILP